MIHANSNVYLYDNIEMIDTTKNNVNVNININISVNLQSR